MRTLFRRNLRVAVTLSAAVGAILAASVIAGTGSAQSTPRALHLVGTAQQGIGFTPDHNPPHQGDRIGGGAKITGDENGISRTVCTRIGQKALCNLQIQLSKGKLSAQGLVPNVQDRTPIAITGGTGAYDGARGTAIVTQTSKTKNRITITLDP
jgi:hypothetical protein